MPTYRTFLLRASDGEPIAELPANGLTVTKVLTGIGMCEFSVPAYSGKGTRDLIAPQQGREIAVVRNDTHCVFNGPLIKTVRDVEGNAQVTALDCSYYLQRRVTEGARAFNRPVLAIVSNLFDMALGRNIPPLSTNSPTKPNGRLYRYENTPRDGGPVKKFSIGSTDRFPILEVLGDLADDDVGGFDWRWDYGWNADQTVFRTFRLGQPMLGVDRPSAIVEPPALSEFSDTESFERAATRWHVLGAGTGTGAKRAFGTHNGLHAAGMPLLESVADKTNINDQATLDAIVRQLLRTPERILTSTIRYRDSRTDAGILFGDVDLGDTVRVKVAAGDQFIDIRRRVVAETLAIGDDNAEFATWTFNNPLDEV